MKRKADSVGDWFRERNPELNKAQQVTAGLFRAFKMLMRFTILHEKDNVQYCRNVQLFRGFQKNANVCGIPFRKHSIMGLLRREKAGIAMWGGGL